MKQTEPPLVYYLTEYYLKNPEKFYFDKLEANEMEQINGQPWLAKIPQIDGRIRFKEGRYYGTDVLLVIGREKDEETGEITEETVRLGSKMDGPFSRMMKISDVYHDYFDSSGNLIFDPMKEDEADENEADETADTPDNADMPDPSGQPTDARSDDVPEDSRQSSDTPTYDAESALRKRVEEELKQKNSIQLGDTTLVRYPDTAGTRVLKANKHGVRHVQYVYEQWYDPEKRQCRNRKTVIGQMSDEFPGAMIPNDRYRRYFDPETGLPRRQDEENSAETAADIPENPEPGQREREALQRTVVRYGMESPEAIEVAIRYLDQLTPENDEKGLIMNDQGSEAAIIGQNEQGKTGGDDLQALYSQVSRQKERITILIRILNEINSTICNYAKRHPDDLISPYKVRRINAILTEIRTYYVKSGYEDLLELIPEPETVEQDGEEMLVGMTYSDVEVLLDHYVTILSYIRIGH